MPQIIDSIEAGYTPIHAMEDTSRIDGESEASSELISDLNALLGGAAIERTAVDTVEPLVELVNERSYRDIIRDLDVGIDCTVQDAIYLIDWGQAHVVARYLENFVKLGGNDIATLLINAGEGDAVASNLEKFTDLDPNDIASQLIETGQDRALAHSLRKFVGLSSDIALRLIEADWGYQVASNLEKFTNLDHNDIALRLIDAGQVNALAMNLFKLDMLDEIIAEQLINANETEAVTYNLKKFVKLGSNIAIRLINEGQVYEVNEVASNLDKFTDLNSDLALHFINRYRGDVVASNLEKFTDLDHNDIALRLIEKDQSRALVMNLYKFDMLDGTIAEQLIEKELIEKEELLGNFHVFVNISDEALRKFREFTGTEWLTEYPRDAKNEATRDRWFGAMSYAYLEGGFEKRSLGRIIRVRIEQGLEHSIHDASQWLSTFQMPESAYDVSRIVSERKRSDFDPEDFEPETLIDTHLESAFFGHMLVASPELRKRMLLSAKDGVAEQLFSTPERRLLYKSLTSTNEEGVPLYKQEQLDWDDVAGGALVFCDQYVADSYGNRKDETQHSLSEEELRERIWNIPADPTEESVSVVIQKLKAAGTHRARYVRDTQAWLLKHATSPHERLTKVWSDRPASLLENVHDSATSIERWQKERALDSLVEQYEQSGELATIGLTREQVFSDERIEWRSELGRVLSAQDTLEGIAKFERWKTEHGDTPKVLKPQTIPVVLDSVPVSSQKPYRFDILEQSDPRGFTIGNDTGCCMTINGASKSCIKEGYVNPNAGFVALYNPSGDLIAQSFSYVHPDYPDVLVLDNVEANEGRDNTVIIQAYRAALEQYITNNPDQPIKNVHIGTGYTEVNIGGLPRVASIPALNDEVYTDAHKQVKLI